MIGILLIAIAFETYPIASISKVLEAVYGSTELKITLGLIGAFLIVFTIIVLQLTVGKMQREKTIAFENPDGQVLISLTAIEDFIRRAIKQLPEVKELRPNVRATKKGVTITSRVTLFSDINLPDTTEKIQNIVKSRVQNLLGIEEPVHIRVHVAKIANKEAPVPKEPKKEEKAAPFRGIEYSSE
jgi:uncharacterized alkaline shock family protein YloU